MRDRKKGVILEVDSYKKDMTMNDTKVVYDLSLYRMAAEIKTADVAKRKSILAQKAARHGVVLPEEVADYLAGLTGNVRELEGFVMRLAAYASLVETEISLSLALFLASREWE